MLYISGPRLVACACLDGNLRLYKYDLKLKSTLPWGETVVFDMHHIKSSNEIIISGAQGIKVCVCGSTKHPPVCSSLFSILMWNHKTCCGMRMARMPVHHTWGASASRHHSSLASLSIHVALHGFLRFVETVLLKNDDLLVSSAAVTWSSAYVEVRLVQIYYTEPDFEAYARSVKDPEDVVSAECNPWAFGQCQLVKARLCLRVPGLESQHPDSYRQGAQSLWLADADAIVFTAVRGSVFAFSVVDGSCVAAWDRLHTQHISAFLYLPDRHQAVSVCEAPKAIVWKVQAWYVYVPFTARSLKAPHLPVSSVACPPTLPGAQESQVCLLIWCLHFSRDGTSASPSLFINRHCNSGWIFEDVVHGNVPASSFYQSCEWHLTLSLCV